MSGSKSSGIESINEPRKKRRKIISKQKNKKRENIKVKRTHGEGSVSSAGKEEVTVSDFINVSECCIVDTKLWVLYLD